MPMSARFTSVLALLLFFLTPLPAQQSDQDLVLQTTRNWLKGMSTGDRTALNAIMDPRFVATTPAGDVLAKERLVPLDTSQAVQQLPPFDVDSPLIRVYGDTAVLMGRLKASPDPKQMLDATFVYSKRGNEWKLVAVQLSSHK